MNMVFYSRVKEESCHNPLMQNKNLSLLIIKDNRGEEMKQEDFWEKFHHGAVKVNGVRLHYVEGGSGPSVLLIPGWPESWYAWRRVIFIY